jgi:hypothetical protein
MNPRDDRRLSELPPLVAAQREMGRGERLIWADRPARSASLRETVRGVLTGLGFAAFAVVWSGLAYILTVGNSEPPFSWFPFFGIPFVLFGLLMVVGTLRRLRVTNATLYVLTASRFLVLSDRPTYRVRSYDLASLLGVDRIERRNGSGTLILKFAASRAERFVGVPEIARVAAEIDRLRRKAHEDALATRTG